jgi:hypothetical protein
LGWNSTMSEKHQWACSQGAVGSRDAADYTLTRDELGWYGFPGTLERLGAATGAAPRLLGLDCEMVLTTEGPALARVSLVEWQGGQCAVVLDCLVKPPAPVLDHLTAFSGITAADLDAATATAADARAALQKHVCADDILCGHELVSDLRALGVTHGRVIDTTVLYPHQDGPPERRALDALCLEFLKRKIQHKTHSSVEDAAATLELVRLRISSGQGRLVWRRLADDEQKLFSEPTLAVLLDRMKLDPMRVQCVYLRGSRAVGYAGIRGDGSPSDWDFVVVVKDESVTQEDIHLAFGNMDVALYDERAFRRLLQNCSIWALECIYAPRRCVYLEKLDGRALFAQYRASLPHSVFCAKLRQSVSYESSRQWNKAKRAIGQKGSPYSARKSLFIAMRFVIYGIELAKTGEIADIACANAIWEQHLKDDPRQTWGDLRREYEPRYKLLKAEFSQVAPKLPRYGGPRFQFQTAPAREAPNRRIATNSPRAPLAGPSGEAGLATCRLLRAYPDPEAAISALEDTFQIAARRHQQYPHLIQFRYTPQSSPADHPVVLECRALILDASRDWAVVAYPFDRFFNLREAGAPTSLDLNTAKVFEKLDGSLATLYWHDGDWHVASSRRPDASGLMGMRSADGGILFKDLFWEIWTQLKYERPAPGSRLCFMYELTSSRHPIIVRHPEDRLTLIGVRDLETLREVDPGPVAEAHGWAHQAPLAMTPEQAQDAASGLDAAIQEGFVICDADFRRAKVKSPDYVRMTWLFPLCTRREALGRRHLLRVILSGEAREFLAYCPEYKEELEATQLAYQRFIAHVLEIDRQLKTIAGPKAFAAEALKYPYAAVLFQLRKTTRRVPEILSRLKVTSVEKWLAAF